MTELDALKWELEQKTKAFDKLHKRHMDLLRKQGELERENKQLKQRLLERERMLDVRDKIIADVIKAVNGDVE